MSAVPMHAVQSERTVDLGALVITTIEAHPEDSPQAICKRVLDELDESEYRSALEQSMLRFVRAFRPRITMNAAKAEKAVKPSARWDQAGKIYKVLRGTWVALDGSGSNSKPLSECTPADCRVASDIRMRQAEGNVREAKRFQLLAGLVEKAGKSVVGDLDEVTLIEAFR